MNISIKAAKKEHMGAIIELLQSLSCFEPEKADWPSIWDEVNSQSNYYLMVAFMDKQLVGYGSLLIETKIRGGKMGHVEDIVCHPLFRTKGIGTSIVNALCEIAKKKCCYKIALQCKESNIRFYEKCGYEINGFALQKFLD